MLKQMPEWQAWHSINNRCHCPNNPGWKYYGGRGIKNNYSSFGQFLSDVGIRPNRLYSIDRIDNNGNYEPGNCRWASKKQQMNNKRQRKSKYKSRADMLHAYYLRNKIALQKKKLDKMLNMVHTTV